MWPKQSRKSPRETSNSPLQPLRKKISHVYSGSPDSPCIRRSVPRLSNSDDIKRNLSNITDDDYDQGYSVPTNLASFPSFTSHPNLATIISSSPCNSVDSGFQSPTGLQSPLNGTYSFSLKSQPNSSSSPVYLIVKGENQSLGGRGCGLVGSPDEAVILNPEFTTPSSVPGSNQTTAIDCQGSTKYQQLVFTTPEQDENQLTPNVCQNLLSTLSEKPGASSVKIIYLNPLELPSSSSPAPSQCPSSFNKNRSPPKDIVIEILKSENCQTPKLLNPVKSKGTSSKQTPNSDQPFSKRPSHSYEKLILSALNSRRDKKMTLKEIRKYVEDTYPFYKNSATPGWKDSIRHNLSVSKLFVKESPKYGSCWKLASSPKEPAKSLQEPSASSGTECQTRLSNSNSPVHFHGFNSINHFVAGNSNSQSPANVPCAQKTVKLDNKGTEHQALSDSNSPVPRFHVFNSVNQFPTGNSNSQSNVPSTQQKVKLKKRGPLPILPRLNVDPQAYVLVPLKYFCNPAQNNSPVISQLPSAQSVSGSSPFIPGGNVIPQSTSTHFPVTSTPISASPDNGITTKDLLAPHQSSVLSPLAPNQISRANPNGQTIGKTPVFPTAVQPCYALRSPDRSKQLQPRRICAKPNTETKLKLQESPILERSNRRQKLSSDRKSRRKQKLICKEMSPLESSRSDAEITSPEKDQILPQLPQAPTHTNLNTIFSLRTSPSGSDTHSIVSSSQILLPSGGALLDNPDVEILSLEKDKNSVQLPQPFTNTNLNTLFSVKTSSPSGIDNYSIVSPSQIFLPSGKSLLDNCDVEIASPETDKLLLNLPSTPTNTNLNSFFSIKTPSPPETDGHSNESMLDNSFLKTPPNSQKLMLSSFKLSPDSVEVEPSLKDDNEFEFWDLNYS